METDGGNAAGRNHGTVCGGMRAPGTGGEQLSADGKPGKLRRFRGGIDHIHILVAGQEKVVFGLKIGPGNMYKIYRSIGLFLEDIKNMDDLEEYLLAVAAGDNDGLFAFNPQNSYPLDSDLLGYHTYPADPGLSRTRFRPARMRQEGFHRSCRQR